MRSADPGPAGGTSPGAGDLRPPVPFSTSWLIAGAALLVLAVAVLVLVLRRPRARDAAAAAEPAVATAPGAGPDERQRRAEALAELDVVEREARAGRMSPRDVGHRTAHLLRLAGTPAATAASASCRPWQFRPRPPADPEPLLRTARAALEGPATPAGSAGTPPGTAGEDPA